MPFKGAVCIICTEHYDGQSGLSSIPCGHVFHTDCLNEWFDKAPKRTCPQCRQPISRKNLVCKLFLDFPEEGTVSFRTDDLPQNEFDLLKRELNEKEQECEKRKGTISKLSGIIDIHKTTIDKLKIDVAREQSVVSTLKAQLKNHEKKSQDNKVEIQQLRTQMKTFESVSNLIAGQREEVENMIRTVGGNKSSVEQLATFCVSLKKEYEKLGNKLKATKATCEQLRREVLASNLKAQQATMAAEAQKGQMTTFQTDLARAEKEIDRLKRRMESIDPLQKSPLKENSSDLDGLNITDISTPTEMKLERKRKRFEPDPDAQRKESQVTGENKWVNSRLFQKKSHLNFASSKLITSACYDGLGGRARVIRPSAASVCHVKATEKKKSVNVANRDTRNKVFPGVGLEKFFGEGLSTSGIHKRPANVIILSDTD